jgi:hypothetical protein
MTRRFAICLLTLLAPVALAGVALAAGAVPGPAAELIETTSRKLLEALDADRELAKDPSRCASSSMDLRRISTPTIRRASSSASTGGMRRRTSKRFTALSISRSAQLWLGARRSRRIA